jgi:GntR family transcriptional regulator, carbon starvation induced regulator
MTVVHQHDEAVEPTISAAVLRRIRADIVGCHLPPDERLRVETLRARYGVGGSPIREALMRLEAEGLVMLEQNKGFRVSSVSRAQLQDLTTTRIEIEEIALRWSIEKGSVEWEAELLAAFHRLLHLKKIERGAGTNAAWFREHRNFHKALVAACGSPLLMSIRDGLFDQAERYVALSIMSKFPTRNDIGEHEQIMRAALSRNVARASELHRAHIERTTERVAKSLTAPRPAIRLQVANAKAER